MRSVGWTIGYPGSSSEVAHTTAGPDLDEAVAVERQAVEATPSGDPALAERLSNPGTALTARFQSTQESADLDAAIETMRQAVAATPPGDPALAERLSKLGTTLTAGFQGNGASADLDDAIVSQRSGLLAIPSPSVLLRRH